MTTFTFGRIIVAILSDVSLLFIPLRLLISSLLVGGFALLKLSLLVGVSH